MLVRVLLRGLVAAGVQPGILGWVEYGIFAGEFLGRCCGRGFRVTSAQAERQRYRGDSRYTKTDLGQETPAGLAAGFGFGSFNTHNKHLLEWAGRAWV